MRKFPPLNSLKAFDAVARNGSLSKAAAELSVSASAVSQQISLLEDWMDVRFLHRSSNQTRLTTSGVQFANQVTSFFDDLEETVSQTRKKLDRDEIRLSILPSLAARWLISRLPNYSSIHSNSRVMVEASFNIIDFSDEDFTLAIRSGTGPYPGCQAVDLFEEYVAPVCSPDYWDRHRPSLAGIGECTLLSDHTFGNKNTNLDWDVWMSRESVKPSVELKPSQEFTDSNLTIQAAANGEGFMLGRSVLIADEMKRGALIEPFLNRQISDWSYSIVYPTFDHPPDKPLREFIRWLENEAAATPGIVHRN
jgi:LysR family glycine cleavage system transcriptional activator